MFFYINLPLTGFFPSRLCGYTPFRSDNPATLAAETQRGKIEFRE